MNGPLTTSKRSTRFRLKLAELKIFLVGLPGAGELLGWLGFGSRKPEKGDRRI